MRIKVVSSSKATGQLQHAGRQKQGWNPLLPDAEDQFSPRAGFSVRYFRCNCSPGTVARHSFAAKASQGGAVLFANVINLKRLLNGKQNVWKYQNGEEKSDSDGREKDV